MHWYLEVLKKYAVFSGRARRREFWLFTLFNMIIGGVLGIVDGAAGLANAEIGVGPLAVLYGLAVFIPGTAVLVRRLHDTDHRGWWLLIALVPLIGAIVLLVFMARDGQPSRNRFGPNPKELAGPSAPVAATVGGEVRTEAENPTLMAFCIACGTRFPEAAAFCPKCGARRDA